MPPISVVKKLPKKLRDELDERLRASSYGDIILHTEWLQEKGVKCSKSALHRYSMELKTRDRAASSIARDMRDDLSDREAVDLLLELGTLRVKEKRILDRLEEIGYI